MVEADREIFFHRVAENKAKIRAMIEERNGLTGRERDLFTPSQYWARTCEAFEYLWALPEQYFLRLDVHLFHINNWTCYHYFGKAEEFRRKMAIDELIRDIPPELVLNEPKGSIAFELGDGRRLTYDTTRQQRIINTLYRAGALSSDIGGASRGKLVLEIGAGFGGLAYQLSQVLKRTTYVILDLPETLLFSSCYLSLHAPNKSMYLYSPTDTTKQALKSVIQQGCDFVLLPNYRLDLLRDLRYDLVINVASMQEMRTEQVRTYLDFIRDTCAGLFYSSNKEWQPGNMELSGLTDMIKERFQTDEVENEPPWIPLERGKRVFLKTLVRAAVPTGISRVLEYLAAPHARRRSPFGHRELLCRPRKAQDVERENPVGDSIHNHPRMGDTD